MTKMVDIHCHILPYVDDGAENMEESLELLEMEVEQGVETICVTPHWRTGMFETSDADVLQRFRQLRKRAEAEGIPVELALGREYYCDKAVLKKAEDQRLIPLGEGNTLLTEFSRKDSLSVICKKIRLLCSCGYVPLAAHVERYDGVMGSLQAVERMASAGAKIQVNASAVMGRGGLKELFFTRKLLKEHLVDVVASDAHDPEQRRPEMDACLDLIERKYGSAYARAVLSSNPEKLLALR